jgi:hypothetical protein
MQQSPLEDYLRQQKATLYPCSSPQTRVMQIISLITKDKLPPPYDFEMAEEGCKRLLAQYPHIQPPRNIKRRRITSEEVYCARLGCVNFDSARQSQIEAKQPNEAATIQWMVAGHLRTKVPDDGDNHSRIGTANKEDRFGKVAVSQNSHNLSGRNITRAQKKPKI